MRKRAPYQDVRGDALHSAWRKVHQNGLKSLSSETREAIREFDASAPQQIRRIDRQLRQEKFEFIPQKGVLKKRPGKKPRPLVVGAIKNRIVQRAILDVLQQVPPVCATLQNPFSFGGIKGRDRQKAIAALCISVKAGDKYYIRSDIRDFFTKIPRPTVLAFLAQHIPDDKFLDLTKRAMETTLANLDQLGEDVDLFPLGDKGVAQGSPLSPLMGNILLADFDREMNGRGITCLRYIDDFILLGQDLAKVKKAFENAQRKLAAFGMQAYDPTQEPEKTKIGETAKGLDFLGCRINPGFVQPSGSARKKLLALVNETLEAGRRAIISAARSASRKLPRKRFAQTLADVDNILAGWGHSFAFCNNFQLFDQLDQNINKMLVDFLRSAERLMKGSDQAFRRVLGVHLLSDTPFVPLTT